MNKKIVSFALVVLIIGSAGIFYLVRHRISTNETPTVTNIDAVYGPTTPNELFKLTDGIVLGTVENLQVEKISSRIRSGKEDIVTNATIKVEKYLSNPKNLSSSEITVQIVGGTIGSETMVSDDSATFEKGQRVVVFLHREDNGVFTVFRSAQGEFTVNNDDKLGKGKEVEVIRSIFGKDMTLNELGLQIAAINTK